MKVLALSTAIFQLFFKYLKTIEKTKKDNKIEIVELECCWDSSYIPVSIQCLFLKTDNWIIS